MEIRENRKKTETKPKEKKISSEVVPLNCHSMLGRMQKWYRHLEDNLAFSYKTKRTLTKWSSNYAPWYLPKGVIATQKSTHVMFSAALFIIAKTFKQPRNPSVGEWTNCGVFRQWILFSTKKKCYQAMKNDGSSLGYITKWKKSIWKGCTLHDSNYVTF